MTADEVLRGRTWRWLRLQIEELLTAPPQVVVTPWGGVRYVPTTRLGLALAPPDFTPPAQGPGVGHSDPDG